MTLVNYGLIGLPWEPCELRERRGKGVFRAAYPYPLSRSVPPPYSHRTFGYRLTNPQPHGITHWIAYIACFYYNVYYNLLYVYYKCHHVTRPLSFITEIVVKIWMEYWLFFTSVWPVSNVWMNPGGWLHKNRTPYSLTKMCEMVVFHRWLIWKPWIRST